MVKGISMSQFDERQYVITNINQKVTCKQTFSLEEEIVSNNLVLLEIKHCVL